MPRNKSVANRGFVNNTILESLISGDKYGYEIIKEVEEKSNGKIKLKQPSLYSSLKRFESKGFISSYWEDSDIGGRRHYYSITEVGKDYYYNNVVKNPTLKITLPKERKKHTSLASSPVTQPETDTESENYNVFDLLDNEEAIAENEDNNIQDINDDIELSEIKDFDDADENSLDEEITPEIEEVIEENEEENNIEEAKLLEEQNNEYIEEHSEEFKNAEEEIEDSHPTLFAISKRENSSSSNIGIQESMFNMDNEENSFEMNSEEKVNLDALNQIKNKYSNLEIEEEQTIEDKKDIPLLEEKEHEVFSWDDMKRKVGTAKSFSDYSNEENLDKNENSNSENNNSQIVVDEYGIIKLQNDEEIEKPKNRIFDNVILRTNNDPNDVFIKSKQAKQKYDEPELTREEKIQKQENFIQRFDEIATKQKESSNEIDYKRILGDLYTKETVSDEEESNFDDESDVVINNSPDFNENININEDDFEEYNNERITNINLENINPDESFTVDDKEYAQVAMFPRTNKQIYKNHEESLINEGIKLKSFETSNVENSTNKDFILSNKAKFFMVLILGILSILECLAISLILKTKNMFTEIDAKFAAVTYAVISAIILLYAIIFLISPHKRKPNDFKLNYYLIFGFLAFIAVSLLGYAICVLSGLTTLNLNLYLFRLITPIVISFNFVIAPLLYNIFVKDKKFY